MKSLGDSVTIICNCERNGETAEALFCAGVQKRVTLSHPLGYSYTGRSKVLVGKGKNTVIGAYHTARGLPTGKRRVNLSTVKNTEYKASLHTFQQSHRGRMYFVQLPPPSGKRSLLSLLCRDMLSALTVASASGPQANGSLRVYKQQAAEGASSFYGVSPKEAEPSLPQRDFTVFR